MSRRVLIIGGNRFFGRHLANELIREGHQVTLLNRGKIDDGFGDRVVRIHVDRKDESALRGAVANQTWDVVYDQVAYNAEESRAACRIFEGKVQGYVLTSSESVYDDGADQDESAFDPTSYQFTNVVSSEENYQEAKRQVETVFAQTAPFETTIVRPSLVVGTDDYTNRLKWHIDRIKSGLPIYFPNLDLRSDFIRSDQAGNALKIVGLAVQNPKVINCTTRGSITLKSLIEICEEAVGQTAVIAPKHEGDNHSPYGGVATKTMNTDRLYSLGFNAESSTAWMRDLVFQIARSK